MKKMSATGFTVASVLSIALLGGAAGGALVMGSDESAPPRPTEMGLKVADEATTAPGAPLVPAPTMEEPAPGAPAAPKKEAPVTTPTTDADRAEEPAGANVEPADRAEAEPVAAPAPTPEPEAPAPTPEPECEDGETQGVPYRHNGNPDADKYGQGGLDTCINGKWVRTKEPVDAPPPTKPAPTPASGPGNG